MPTTMTETEVAAKVAQVFVGELKAAQVDALVQKHTAFASLAAMLVQPDVGYTPSLKTRPKRQGSDAAHAAEWQGCWERQFIANAYDDLAQLCGDARRSCRY